MGDLHHREGEQHATLPLPLAKLQRLEMMKRIIISDVKRSKLHMSQRSTAPHIVSTSQPPVDRTILVMRSQHEKLGLYHKNPNLRLCFLHRIPFITFG